MTDTYVSIAQVMPCKSCGAERDCRCGVCFECVDKIAGEPLGDGKHKLWHVDRPDVTWIVDAKGH